MQNLPERKLDFGDICQICDIFGHFVVTGVTFRPEIDENRAKNGDEIVILYEVVSLDGDQYLDFIYDEDVVLIARKEHATEFIIKHFSQDYMITNEADIKEFVEMFIGDNELTPDKPVRKFSDIQREEEMKCNNFEYPETTDGLLDAMNDQKRFIKLTGSPSEEIQIHIDYLSALFGQVPKD